MGHDNATGILFLAVTIGGPLLLGVAGLLSRKCRLPPPASIRGTGAKPQSSGAVARSPARLPP
jgi:hypothetical protein